MSKEPVITKTVVTYSQTRKINQGNYESADVFVSCSFETPQADQEEYLYAKAADFVEAKLKEEETLRSQSLNSVTKNKPVEKAEKKSEDKEEKKTSKSSKNKSSKKAKEDEVNDEETSEGGIDFETVKDALKAYAKEHSKDEAKKVIKEVGGVDKLDEIPEDKFSAVLIACEKGPSSDEDEDL